MKSIYFINYVSFQSKVYKTFFFLPKSDFISIPQQKSRSFDKFFVIIDNDGIDKDGSIIMDVNKNS
jgi:hypothetical protein